MRVLRAVLLVVAVGLAVAPAAHASTLFVQDFSGGSMQRVSAQRFDLTVRARGDMTAFADRPARRTWRLATSTFVSRWSSYGFAADPPNAALVIDGAPRNADALAVELLSVRRRRGALIYRVRPMRGDAKALTGYVKRADRLRSGRFSAGSLFIDDPGKPVTLYVESVNWSFPTVSNVVVEVLAGATLAGTPTVSGLVAGQCPFDPLVRVVKPTRFTVTFGACAGTPAHVPRLDIPLTTPGTAVQVRFYDFGSHSYNEVFTGNCRTGVDRPVVSWDAGWDCFRLPPVLVE